MPGRVLLDTNAAIAHLKHDLLVRAVLAVADEVFLPSVALGELYFGAAKSDRPDANTRALLDLARVVPVLACDAETAPHYGLVKADLRRRGRPIPDNDLWIAAIARQHGLAIVTRDAHFNEVESIRTVSW